MKTNKQTELGISMKMLSLTLLTLSSIAIQATELSDAIDSARTFHTAQQALAALSLFSNDYEGAKRVFRKSFDACTEDFNQIYNLVEVEAGKKPAKKLIEWNKKKQKAQKTSCINTSTSDDVKTAAVSYQSYFGKLEALPEYTCYRDSKKAYKGTVKAYLKEHTADEDRVSLHQELKNVLGEKAAKKISKWFKKM